jgi:hypothetical protein
VEVAVLYTFVAVLSLLMNAIIIVPDVDEDVCRTLLDFADQMEAAACFGGPDA